MFFCFMILIRQHLNILSDSVNKLSINDNSLLTCFKSYIDVLLQWAVFLLKVFLCLLNTAELFKADVPVVHFHVRILSLF